MLITEEGYNEWDKMASCTAEHTTKRNQSNNKDDWHIVIPLFQVSGGSLRQTKDMREMGKKGTANKGDRGKDEAMKQYRQEDNWKEDTMWNIKGSLVFVLY